MKPPTDKSPAWDHVLFHTQNEMPDPSWEKADHPKIVAAMKALKRRREIDNGMHRDLLRASVACGNICFFQYLAGRPFDLTKDSDRQIDNVVEFALRRMSAQAHTWWANHSSFGEAPQKSRDAINAVHQRTSNSMSVLLDHLLNTTPNADPSVWLGNFVGQAMQGISKADVFLDVFFKHNADPNVVLNSPAWTDYKAWWDEALMEKLNDQACLYQAHQIGQQANLDGISTEKQARKSLKM